MAATSNYRLSDASLDKDRATLVVIRDLADYTPVNQKQSIESLVALQQAHHACREAVLRAQTVLAAARAAEIDAGWEFHSAILGAKTQISAQYGDDAHVIQAIGRTRRSDRKRPVRQPRRAKP